MTILERTINDLLDLLKNLILIQKKKRKINQMNWEANVVIVSIISKIAEVTSEVGAGLFFEFKKSLRIEGNLMIK